MKRSNIVLGVLLAPLHAAAAAVFGLVVVDDRLPARPMPIEIVCDGTAIAKAVVDVRGAYRIVGVPARNGCVVRMEGAMTAVALSANPTRLNLALSHSGGRPTLVQR